jgi:hypothetical protein
MSTGSARTKRGGRPCLAPPNVDNPEQAKGHANARCRPAKSDRGAMKVDMGLLFFLRPHNIEATSTDYDNRCDECKGRPIHGFLPSG